MARSEEPLAVAPDGTAVGPLLRGLACTHTRPRSGPEIQLPKIGLALHVRLSSKDSGGQVTIIETVNAPGFGPPLHRHAETEVFHVLNGRYLFQVDDRRFHAEAGDVVGVPGGAAHAFVNVTDAPAGQLVMILPGLDAAAFFADLHAALAGGVADRPALDAFGRRWNVEFLGPPLEPN